MGRSGFVRWTSSLIPHGVALWGGGLPMGQVLLFFQNAAALVGWALCLILRGWCLVRGVPDRVGDVWVFWVVLEVTAPHSRTLNQPLRRLSDRTHSVNPPFLGLSSPSPHALNLGLGIRSIR